MRRRRGLRAEGGVRGLARREYRLLGELQRRGLPAVPAMGVCLEQPQAQDAILVTRYLDYSMSYRYLLPATGRGSPRTS